MGLTMALTASHDVAIIDLMLPKMDGLALIGAMRKEKIHPFPQIFNSELDAKEKYLTERRVRRSKKIEFLRNHGLDTGGEKKDSCQNFGRTPGSLFNLSLYWPLQPMDCLRFIEKNLGDIAAIDQNSFHDGVIFMHFRHYKQRMPAAGIESQLH